VSVVKSNQYNSLMSRSEVNCVFQGMSGRLDRTSAVAAVSKELKFDVEKIVLVRMIGSTGTSDLLGLFYLYDDIKAAHKQLPSHLFSRLKPKEAKSKEAETAAEKPKADAKSKEAETAAEKPKADAKSKEAETAAEDTKSL